ncbi:NAD kinase 2, mitochondrial isoform X2 [Copidosoma floridanum]|uniref:NAD kinase 2, mitochondrial isoform X2 n=1 Tax=Copidosoma floridanum TaxID=29053 RepID=UPI0006C9BF5F|nr:NAD kinase 2, mitochondrial isoform X2 [Copidosoma floridanum]
MTALAHLRRGSSGTQQLFKLQSACAFFQCHESSFVPKRVLIFKKISRYQIEKNSNPQLNESELKHKLVSGGANYDAIKAVHYRTKETELRVVKALADLDISFKIRNRYNVDVDIIAWADLILPIGGDGTFLMASNLIRNNTKPIIGINSDPEFSEGFLMLPSKYTNLIDEIFEKLKSGHFKHLMRSRIRTTLHGEDIWQVPFHLHDKNSSSPQEKFYESHHNLIKPKGDLPKSRHLPWLALNEVFIGESLSAKISILHIHLGNENIQKVKCSGMCITTGTGSSSWYRAINYLNPQTVEDVLRMAGCKDNYSSEDVKKICSDFNAQLQYPAANT